MSEDSFCKQRKTGVDKLRADSKTLWGNLKPGRDSAYPALVPTRAERAIFFGPEIALPEAHSHRLQRSIAHTRVRPWGRKAELVNVERDAFPHTSTNGPGLMNQGFAYTGLHADGRAKAPALDRANENISQRWRYGDEPGPSGISPTCENIKVLVSHLDGMVHAA
ncbi:hypothetical protein M405DRAFT_884339 [Rhizopogon salebrosus TDB-379]|nr:hypothetical protein M405DRAFT_884339 [Rhizopogon salebrosus TDB-379]